MIRRKVENEFWLITQHDHALLAGELAGHVGNRLFDTPTHRRESFIAGVTQHDCGWPLHDVLPTLNSNHLPIDVFESTSEIALMVWQASVDRTISTGDDYAAVLVSLHVLALSGYAMNVAQQPDAKKSRARFELNRFQHKQIEIQEMLRKKLNLPVDQPMRQGLVEDPQDAGERELQFHFRLLQAMDLISLALCCTDPPVETVRPVLIRPGGKSVTLNLKRQSPTTLHISPWPFDSQSLAMKTPFRRVLGLPWASSESFLDYYNESKTEHLSLSMMGG